MIYTLLSNPQNEKNYLRQKQIAALISLAKMFTYLQHKYNEHKKGLRKKVDK